MVPNGREHSEKRVPVRLFDKSKRGQNEEQFFKEPQRVFLDFKKESDSVS